MWNVRCLTKLGSAKLGTTVPDCGTGTSRPPDGCCHFPEAVRAKSADNDTRKNDFRPSNAVATIWYTFVVPNCAIPSFASPPPPPPCDIPSGCCSFTGPWTVPRSSLRMLRRVAAFCRPVRPVLLLVSFPCSRSPIVGVAFACQWRPVVGVLGVVLVVAGVV